MSRTWKVYPLHRDEELIKLEGNNTFLKLTETQNIGLGLFKMRSLPHHFDSTAVSQQVVMQLLGISKCTGPLGSLSGKRRQGCYYKVVYI